MNMRNQFLNISQSYREHFIVVSVGAIIAIAILGGSIARAATTANVTATVSATNLAVSVSDGTIAFGSVALNAATSTDTYGDETQTATNDGSNAQLNVKGSDATGGTTWTLDTSNVTTDHYQLEVSTTTGSTWMDLVDSSTYTTASTTFDSLTSGDIDFQLTTPTDSSDFVEKSITITVQVTTP